MATNRTLRPVPRRDISEIASQWDLIASSRDAQIASGVDISYHRVLVPTLLDLIALSYVGRIVDLGCGTGRITELLADRAGEVVGVDVSSESIRMAKERCRCANVRFVAASIEEFSTIPEVGQFDLAVANMVLMDVPDLSASLDAIASLVRPGGTFVFTITHPCFWPMYAGYAQEPWYRYESETMVEGLFAVSLSELDAPTTHVHRPLNAYLNSLSTRGFVPVELREPFPEKAIESLYPERWRFPRFLAARYTREPLQQTVEFNQ